MEGGGDTGSVSCRPAGVHGGGAPNLEDHLLRYKAVPGGTGLPHGWPLSTGVPGHLKQPLCVQLTAAARLPARLPACPPVHMPARLSTCPQLDA